jgi:DNA-binding IclR family transcriptional regulator
MIAPVDDIFRRYVCPHIATISATVCEKLQTLVAAIKISGLIWAVRAQPIAIYDELLKSSLELTYPSETGWKLNIS